MVAAKAACPSWSTPAPAPTDFKNAREYLTPENQERFDRLTIVDSIEFVHDQLAAQARA